MGNSNTHGELGNGTQLPSTAFAPWGEGTYARIATGTGNEVCAIDMRGNVRVRAGNGFKSTPLVVGTDAHSFWIDTAGAVHLDDVNVFCASNGRAEECTVEAAGLVQRRQVTFGSAGQVIDGTTVKCSTTEPRLCWLEGNGRAKCGDPGVPPLIGDVFDAAFGPILYLSGNIYMGSLCAVASDGSLWCIGANDSGQLGTGSMESLTVEQQVRCFSPGSVKGSDRQSDCCRQLVGRRRRSGRAWRRRRDRAVALIMNAPRGVTRCGSATEIIVLRRGVGVGRLVAFHHADRVVVRAAVRGHLIRWPGSIAVPRSPDSSIVPPTCVRWTTRALPHAVDATINPTTTVRSMARTVNHRAGRGQWSAGCERLVAWCVRPSPSVASRGSDLAREANHHEPRRDVGVAGVLVSLAEMFANRVRKNARHLGKWAKRTGVTCWRVYDRDIPELPDHGRHLRGRARDQRLPDRSERCRVRLDALAESAKAVMDATEVFIKRRERLVDRQAGHQYERSRRRRRVAHGGRGRPHVPRQRQRLRRHRPVHRSPHDTRASLPSRRRRC